MGGVCHAGVFGRKAEGGGGENLRCRRTSWLFFVSMVVGRDWTGQIGRPSLNLLWPATKTRSLPLHLSKGQPVLHPTIGLFKPHARQASAQIRIKSLNAETRDNDMRTFSPSVVIQPPSRRRSPPPSIYKWVQGPKAFPHKTPFARLAGLAGCSATSRKSLFVDALYSVYNNVTLPI